MKFYTIRTNCLSEDDIEIFDIEADDEYEAYDLLDESCHQYDRDFLLTKKQYKKLKKMLK